MAKTYHVARTINAEIDRVWDLLTDANGYPEWNTTVVSLGGSIEAGESIALVSTVNPKRSFDLEVTELTRPSRMEWSDGMPLGMFKGVRTFPLAEVDGATEFTMSESFSGPLSGLITKMIPDMADNFNEFADCLKFTAEAPTG